MQLSRFPRQRFAHLPTPLERLDRLSRLLGGPSIWIKRDDCTGLGLGGNKTRKLEYLMADAIARGADTVLTVGAVQSNHARQTAAAAARLGLACDLVLEARVSEADEDYRHSGNILLDRLFGARLHEYPAGTEMAGAMAEVADGVKRRGGTPYVIPGGGSNPVGALGYVNFAVELLAQATERGIVFDQLIHATGSSGTQAGLVVGLEGLRAGLPVLGITVRRTRESQEEQVLALVEATADFVGVKGAVPRGAIVANSDYVGGGYGVPTPGMLEAVRTLAREESILLDPVYSGKAMAGLIDLVRRGAYTPDQNILFLHTGGQPALFAYRGALDRANAP
ncbi:D-cysteine desulfhydrase [Stella humosa]|uniref:L-cysteate sulfo-lyase n=1 Tax=Stella humosa TaxID=94 RepID=A0A3N1M355_9PROT|nr:D-cysteine desulfhydrase [Stella humosa]ROQ00162.1 D-cysteine desulfhydrase [Stella humosa]BBK30604.1 1-aminocyclopropane-1-carboxylate deaminase [Stella humosa]